MMPQRIRMIMLEGARHAVRPVRVPSLRSTLRPMPGTGGSGGTGSGPLGVFRSRLQRKGYTELMPPQPLELAMTKSGPLAGTKIVAFVDLDAGTDGMQGVLTRLESWFDTALPRHGYAALVFMKRNPSAVDAETAMSVGVAPFTTGMYDASVDRHWMRNDFGFAQEIFED